MLFEHDDDKSSQLVHGLLPHINMHMYPPPFLHSNRPCIVSITFSFANLLGRPDIELVLCVCWLDKVVVFVHCCVVQVSGIQGTPLYPVLCRIFQFFLISAMGVDHIDTYPAGAVVNFKRSGGSIVPTKFWAPQSTMLTTGPSHMSALALCFSVELNTHPNRQHPNRQFPAHFVCHAILCLHVLFRVAHPLHSNQGCEGTIT